MNASSFSWGRGVRLAGGLGPGHWRSVLLLWATLFSLTAAEHTFYFATDSSINLYQANVSSVIFSLNKTVVESLDYSSRDQMLYWAELTSGEGRIRRGSPTAPGAIEDVVSMDLHDLRGMAVDWVSGNVYFTDRRLTGPPSTDRLEVVTGDGSLRRVLLNNLTEVGSIAVNPNTGYLYYSVYDGDMFTRVVYQAKLDGTCVEPIIMPVANVLEESTSLFIDTASNTLYWSIGNDVLSLDITQWQATKTLQPTILDISSGFDPFGVAVGDGVLYWSQRNSSSPAAPGALFARSLGGGGAEVRLPLDPGVSPGQLSTATSRTVSGGCADSNGMCTKFCFTVPGGQGSTSTACGCPTGIIINADNVSCRTVPQKFLLFIQQTENAGYQIRQVSLETTEYIDTLIPIAITGQASFLTYDWINDQVYWSEVGERPAIRRASIDGSNVENFISTGLRHPEDLVVDPYSKLLFWTDSSLDRIEVVRTEVPTDRKVLYHTVLRHPQGLALDLRRRYLYWTDLNQIRPSPTVERILVNGTYMGPLSIPDENLPIVPTNIAVDIVTGDAYWADSHSSEESIVHYNVMTNMAMELPNFDLRDVLGLTVVGEYVYWTDRGNNQQSLARASLPMDGVRSSGPEVVLKQYGGLLGLVGVDTADNSDLESLCGFNQGGCSHLCLPSGDGIVCACPEHLVLDGNNCLDTTHMPFVATETLLSPLELDVDASANHETWVRINSDPNCTENCHKAEWRVSAKALDIDYAEMRGYYIGLDDELIYSIDLANSTAEPRPLVICCTGQPQDLAVDWLGRNLYWSDASRRSIELVKLNGASRYRLVEDLASPPGRIVVDPLQGMLYWGATDAPVLFKMKLSGVGEVQQFWLGDTSYGGVTGIAIDGRGTLDTGDDVILWSVEGLINRAFNCDLNAGTGCSSKITLKPSNQPLQLRVFDENLYYWFRTDNSTQVMGDMLHRRLSNGDNNLVLSSSEGLVNWTDFAILHHSTQPGVHECSVKNNDCSPEAVCLVQDDIRGVCECPAHRYKERFTDDMSFVHDNCIDPEAFLLLATPTNAYFFPIFRPGKEPDVIPLPRPLPLGTMQNVTAMTYDPVDRRLLWIDEERSEFVAASLDGLEAWRIDSWAISDVRPLSLAYDYEGGNVFLSERDRFQILQLAVNGGGRGGFNTADYQRPGLLAVAVDDSVLYWTVQHGIEYASLEDLTRISSLPLSERRDFHSLLFHSGSLVWVATADEGAGHVIERYILKTGELQLLASGGSVTGLTVLDYGGAVHAFWYNQTDQFLYSLNLNETLAAPTSLWQWAVPGGVVTSFLGFNRTLFSHTLSTCLDDPRPCSHICLPRPEAPVQCVCPPSHPKGDTNECLESGCESLLACDDGYGGCYPPFYQCDGFSHCKNNADEPVGCVRDCPLLQTTCPSVNGCVPICTGTVLCPGGEDQVSCPLCTEDRLHCLIDSGVVGCLRPFEICDMFDDCIDRSDEMNCTTPSPSTPSPSPTPASTPRSPSQRLALSIGIGVAGPIAILIVGALFLGLCRWFISSHRRGGSRSYTIPHHNQNGNGVYKLSGSPQSGPRSESSEYSEGTSLGTHSTRFSQLSPSSASLKRSSSNPPPSPIMTELDYCSVFSDSDHPVPRAPAPSINYSNYDGMSGISESVSRRNLPVNGFHGPPGYHHQPGARHHHNPYNAHHAQHPYYPQFSPAHYGRPGANHYPLHDLDSQSESESTLSLSTVNTESHDVFRYDSVHDVTPPGRPPSPATVVSELRPTGSPLSPASDCDSLGEC